MNRLQRALLGLYRLAVDRGMLDLPGARWLFEASYHGYKRLVEARDGARLQEFCLPGATVVDVGANIGYFTARFADWVGAGGRVIAIEPEAMNLGRLQARLARSGLASRVEVVPAVAAEAPGRLHLTLNPYHPGDHRIGASGVMVAAVTLDEVLAERGNPPVALVKIDVQGAEQRVLEGMAATLARDRPVLYLEIDDAALRAMGTSAAGLLARLAAFGYAMHDHTARGLGRTITRAEALERLRGRAYMDAVFLPAGRPAG
ncbi:MAG: FkbM family methyltransferase [Alphaproteobacteria bacterium]|nr:FkbM family methyltransferase [Alphaproteobacteria bacterium]